MHVLSPLPQDYLAVHSPRSTHLSQSFKQNFIEQLNTMFLKALSLLSK